jgi:ankyrin repeat protein
MIAAGQGHQTVVAVLLANGAARNQRNARREMARDLALAAGHRDLAKCL